MDQKRLVILSFIVLILFLFTLPAYSSLTRINYSKQKAPTDSELKDLAVEKGMIPYNADQTYFKGELEQKNSISLWLLMDRGDKIKLIENFKRLFKENDNVIIKLPAVYYVNEINGVMYNCLKDGDYDSESRKGLLSVLTTIAMMDGDYDNGKNRVEELRRRFGEELFTYYKKEYPKKYEYLLKLDKESHY